MRVVGGLGDAGRRMVVNNCKNAIIKSLMGEAHSRTLRRFGSVLFCVDVRNSEERGGKSD